MAVQLAVAQVERLVVHQQPDDLAVGDVDDRLAGLRVAVPALGVRQRPPLVEGVEVGARRGVRLPLVEVAAQADVAVGQREDRLGDAEGLHVERRLAHDPRLDGERASRIRAHRFSSNRSARSATTTSAPCSRSASACPSRSTPTTKPNPPARPGLDAGQGVLEHHGLLLRHVQVSRRGEERVGRGLARQVPLLRDHPVDPVVDQVDEPGDLQHHLGVRRRRHHGGRQARVPHGVQVAHGAGVDVDAVGADLLVDELVLAGREAVDRLGVRAVGRLPLRQRDPPGDQEGAGAVQPRLAVDVRAVVGLDVERDELHSRALGVGAQEVVEHLLPRRRVHAGGVGEHPVEVEQAGAGRVGKAEHAAQPTDSRFPARHALWIITRGPACTPRRPVHTAAARAHQSRPCMSEQARAHAAPCARARRGLHARVALGGQGSAGVLVPGRPHVVRGAA